MPVKKGYSKKRYQPKRIKKSSVTITDVKRIVNSAIMKTSELKEYRFQTFDQPVGQVDNLLSGYFSFNCTPGDMNTGTNNVNRIGNKMTWRSMYLNIGIEEQSNASNADCTFQLYLIHDKKPKDNVYVTDDNSNPVEKMFMANPFVRDDDGTVSGVIDGSSPRNSQYLQRFDVLAKKRIFLPGDNFVNATQRNRILTMGHRFKKPLDLRWDQGNYVPSSGGEVFLLVFASAGNINETTASSLEGFVPRTAYQSGYNCSVNAIDYLIDN